MEKTITLDELRKIAANGDISAMYRVASFYCDEDIREEEVIFNDALDDAKSGNIFCMFYISCLYEMGDIVPMSKDRQIYWLKQLVDSEIADAFYCYIDDDSDSYSDLEKNNAMAIVDKMPIELMAILQNLLGAACFKIAQYYRKSVELEEIEYAEKCLDGALAYKYPSYPGPYLVIDMINELEKRKKFLSEHADCWPSPKLLQIESSDDGIIVKTIQEEIISNVGEDIWNNFLPETRRCFMTAMTCLYYLCRLDSDVRLDMDFSAVVLPMMKSLEHELRVRFCDQYIKFLKVKYPTIEEYAKANNIAQSLGRIRKNKKALFIKCDNEEFKYADGNVAYEQFSLGSFKFTLSKVNRNVTEIDEGILVDNTAIEFCETELFRHENDSDFSTEQWLVKLICDVDALTTRRNDSAHGGNVLGEEVAQSTWRDLITIQRILVDLVEKCK